MSDLRVADAASARAIRVGQDVNAWLAMIVQSTVGRTTPVTSARSPAPSPPVPIVPRPGSTFEAVG